MSTLPASATREDIESEIIFTSVLLSTLDPEADDYDEKKNEYEAALTDLEGRLASSARPETPSQSLLTQIQYPTTPSAATSASRTFNLPSREGKASYSNQRPESPLNPTRGSKDIVAKHVVSAAHPSNSAASSFDPKKRSHDKVYPSSSSASSKKVRRRSDLTDASAATTPLSVSSTDQDDDLLEDTAALPSLSTNRQYILMKMQNAERAREARAEAERRDRELARQLESQGSNLSSSFNASQSYFHPNGQWQRPVTNTHSQKANSHQPLNASMHSSMVGASTAPFTQSISEPWQPSSGMPIKSESGLPKPLPFASTSTHPRFNQNSGQPTRHAYPTDHPGHHQTNIQRDQHSRNVVEDAEEDSGSDLQEISADQFISSVQHPDSRNSLPNWSAPMTSMPGSFPSANIGPNPMFGGTSVYGDSTSPWNLFSTSTQQAMQAGSVLWNGVSSVAGGLARHIGGPFGGEDADPTWYGDLGLPGPSMSRAPTYSFEETLHARGLDYMLADPTKTKEDLEALLANIRPDEELPPEMRVGTPEQLKISLMEHQKLGLAWLQQQEESSNKGGILADDMGLGKTIQALALMATRPSEDIACKTTLIVAPVSLLNQWKREISQKVHARHRMSVYMMHGRSKPVTYEFLCTHDVVITTYGTIGSEYKNRKAFEDRRKTNPNAVRQRSEQAILLGAACRWHRVILDEAQMIKNKDTKAALGCQKLSAKYRLCMTGTPMMNNVGELFSLVRFLRISPFNDLQRFNRDIKRPIESRYEAPKNRAMKQLQGLLKAILLRRTKLQKSMASLSSSFRSEQLKSDMPSSMRTNALFTKPLKTRQFSKLANIWPPVKIGRNYSYILVRLLRLRQACCHPLMIQDFAQDGPGNVSQEEMSTFVKDLSDEVVLRIKETQGQFECPICYDAVQNPTIFFPCGHDCCLDCFARITDPSAAVAVGDEGAAARCPECRTPVNEKKVFDYNAFKKVHLAPEEEEADAEEVLLEATAGSETESDDEDDSDSDSTADDDEDDNESVDSQGDLRDFVVPDEEFPDDEPNSELEEDKKSGAEEKASIKETKVDTRGRKKKPSKSKKSKGKGKSKVKGKEKSKEKKKDPVKRLAELRKEGLRNAKAKKKYLRILRRKWVTSAKVEKTMEILASIAENDPSEKVIVFSQFTSFLDLLELPIDGEQWKYRRYDGSMSAKERNAAVEAFQDKPEVKLMLVSLKAGNAGLNLTAASQVIIMDPFWNPFIEEQAVDRAHRIGQVRPVVVHRILVENTVEDRIIALQEKKRSIINEALDEKAGQSLSRLGLQELRYLFGISSALPQ